MGTYGFNGGILWLHYTDGANCFIGKQSIDNASHFFIVQISKTKLSFCGRN